MTGLVGQNGAGKSTLLNLAAGLLRPTTGTIEVCGGRPASDVAQLAKVGFVAQDTPTYAGLSVRDHLRLGAHLNPGWDDALAWSRVERLGLDPGQRAGRLSGGQRAQLALALGLAKRPELLILDEPVASLDPFARREFLQLLMEAVAEQELSVVLSSHVVSDLERVCDHVVVLVDAEVRLAGDVETLLDTHHRLTGPRRAGTGMPRDQQVVSAAAHRPAEHARRAHRGPDPRPRRGRSRRSGSRTSCSRTWNGRPRPARPRRWRCCGDLAVLAPVPAPRHDRGGRRGGRGRRARRHRPPARRPRGGGRRPGLRPAHPDRHHPLLGRRHPRGRGPRRRGRVLGRPAGRPRARGGHPPAGLDAVGDAHPLARDEARRHRGGRGAGGRVRSRWP